jgi:NitT/TauT family transport system ATP-binding protein
MKERSISVGYIPLSDAAPLIAAHEMGFAAQEGIILNLRKAPSWSSLRDMLAFGQVDAAHMLAPVPVASALGLGGAGVRLSAVSVLSVNGTVIGVSNALAAKLRANGHDFAFNNADAAGNALIRTVIEAPEARLRVGVPFPFSMHAELLSYWLTALGLPAPQSLDIKTVPPSLMADAIKAGEIDAFCVGEPWGSLTVENGDGELLLPGAAIWSCAPEKVLAVRETWAEQEPDTLQRLMRAVWRAGRWLEEGGARVLVSELLARPEYLNLPSELLDRAFSGRLVISPAGAERSVPQFIEFHKGAASFPWRSQAEWIGGALARRLGLDYEPAIKAARGAFRSDLHRQALASLPADLPGASSKLEGSSAVETAVASESGRLILQPNRFFDGRVFEPISD